MVATSVRCCAADIRFDGVTVRPTMLYSRIVNGTAFTEKERKEVVLNRLGNEAFMDIAEGAVGLKQFV